MPFARLCDEVLSIDPNVLMAGVVREGRLVISRFKPLVPQLNHDRMAIVLAQAHIMTSIPRTNEDIFGKVRFTMVHHDTLHTFMFPLATKSGDEGGLPKVFVAVVKPPYDPKLANKVLGYLSNTVAL